MTGFRVQGFPQNDSSSTFSRFIGTCPATFILIIKVAAVFDRQSPKITRSRGRKLAPTLMISQQKAVLLRMSPCFFRLLCLEPLLDDAHCAISADS